MTPASEGCPRRRGWHGEGSAQRHGEAARRRPPQSPGPDDEHGAAGDRHAGAGAARRCAAGAERAPDRRRRWSPAPPRSARPPATPQINQSSQRAAIDWKSFDVGSQQSVTFSQPSASAVALNRVTGPDPSQIAGRIDANGQIILVNQSGVNFYKGAQVNAAGVMVSTIGASDQSVKSFVASTSGKLTLDQPGNPNAQGRQPGQHHHQAGRPRRAGGAAGGQFRHDHREAGPRGAGRREDRDAGSVWRRAAVAGCHQPGDAGAGGQGRQGGDRAGDQHRGDHRRWRHGAADRARGRRRRRPGRPRW